MIWDITSYYVWNIGISLSANKGPHKEVNPDTFFSEEKSYVYSYRDLAENDILWINSHSLNDFYEKILPKLNTDVYIIISDGDATFPSNYSIDVKKFLSNENIKHIFVQNCDYVGEYTEKITLIPIGIDKHSVAYRGGGWQEPQMSPVQQDELIDSIFKNNPLTQYRKIGAFVDFQHSDTMRAGFKRYLQYGEDRTIIFNILKETGLIDYGPRMKRSDLWRKKTEYAFSICPMGNGLSSHRLWEDLILGCIVIVKTSPLDPLYDGLPVVIIKDWSEITYDNMLKWKDEYNPNKFSREKLTNEYWIKKIREKIT